MSIKSKLNYFIMMVAPESIKEILTKKKDGLMLSEIRSLEIESSSVTTIDNVDYPTIKLRGGPILIGEIPTRQERAVFGWVVEKLGATPQHAKVCLDAITRFRYAHSATGYVEFPDLPGPHKFFHPQHESFALLEKTFTQEERTKIAKVFRPVRNWNVLDIGGYLGHGMLSMIQQIGDGGEMICVEAKEENVAVIKEHLKANAIVNVEVMYRAIFSEADIPITFTLSSRQANAIDDQLVSGTKRTVPSISIAALIDKLGCRPDLVSLTVNGAELEAIDGMRKIDRDMLPLRMLAPGWYELDGAPRHQKISEILKELGYLVKVTSSGMIYAWLPEVGE